MTAVMLWGLLVVLNHPREPSQLYFETKADCISFAEQYKRYAAKHGQHDFTYECFKVH